MIAGVQNIGRIQELRQRVLFTFGMLAVYRVGAYIVTPGIDPEVVRNFFAQILMILDLLPAFSGGGCLGVSWACAVQCSHSAMITPRMNSCPAPQTREHSNV